MSDSPISLEEIQVFGGEETPHFSAYLFCRGKKVAHVRNNGRGGPCIFHWQEPYDRTWADDKFLPVIKKYAILDRPQFQDLFESNPTEALSLLVLSELDRTLVTEQD